jgi:nitrite reductase (NADH) small subunit
MIVEVEGRKIGLFRDGTEVRAILNTCPHQGGPVGTGGLFPATRARVENRRLIESLDHDSPVVSCPWHGWEFDLRSGVCTADRARRVVTYPAVVRDGQVSVVLPESSR